MKNEKKEYIKAKEEGLVGWKPGSNFPKHIHTHKTLNSYILYIKLQINLTSKLQNKLKEIL